jgi:hypothetical protein
MRRRKTTRHGGKEKRKTLNAEALRALRELRKSEKGSARMEQY